MIKFKSVKGNNVDEADTTVNGIAPDGNVNNGTKLLKNSLDPCEGKGYRVVSEDSYFASMKSTK